ncbi:hypothetical protein R3P38DRAFT_2982630 [Favolaschia claudopus]|uniref:MYND-type domain-containing protein n=1 Tax=Favolaschia claudopus TaxID=2862362 RepID=A0AAW0B014_9AGAR
MVLRLKTKYQIIAPVGAEKVDPLSGTTQICDLAECENWQNLRKCMRCKSAMYCSSECQKTDWPHHKAYCTMVKNFPPNTDPDTGGEPALQRHMRLFSARFTGSLVCATIVALELNAHPENIDDFGIIVLLRPRPHKEAGARFKLHAASVVPMQDMTDIYLKHPGIDRAQIEEIFRLHRQHRDELKAKSGGTEDYATMLLIAQNDGDHAVPGGTEFEMRFKPIAIHRKLVESPALVDPTLDWYISLKIQINRNMPNQSLTA